MSDLTEEKQQEYAEAVENETGESFSYNEASHELYIQCDVTDEGVDFE